MDGITGFNPTAAQDKIDNLYETLEKTMLTFRDGSVNFLDSITRSWYSPKCVEFGYRTSGIFKNIIYEYGKMWNTIMRNTVAAYNVLARANECPSFEYSASGLEYWCGEGNVSIHYADVMPSFESEGPGGEVGMNTTLVKAVILPKFKADLSKFYTALDETPLDIDFYDPNGELKAKFKELIVKFKEFVTEKTNEVVAKLEELLTTEIDNIEIAKEQATDVMNVAA